MNMNIVFLKMANSKESRPKTFEETVQDGNREIDQIYACGLKLTPLLRRFRTVLDRCGSSSSRKFMTCASYDSQDKLAFRVD